MNNEIILRSVYGKVAQTYFINPCPNPRTGRLPDCVRPVKGPVNNTEMILSEDDILQMNSGNKHFVAADKTFEIIDGTVFNLDDIVDEANWKSIEHCDWIAKDRYERDSKGDLVIDGGAKRYGIADLYVERPGEITRLKVTKKQLIHRACDYVYKESVAEQTKKCRVLGRNLANAMPADITDFLIDIAEKNPKKIISLYEEEGWRMQLFIMDAVDNGVIRKSDNIYKYDDKMLAGSLEATVSVLSEPRYRKLLDSIKRETYPNLLPKNVLADMENTIHDGIPHFTEENDLLEETPVTPPPAPEPPIKKPGTALTAKEKAEQLRKK